MATTMSIPLSHRDRAVLRAVAGGRCAIAGRIDLSLVIDGVCCCDQLIGLRLVRAGLIDPAGPQPGPARLTGACRALLEAA